MGLRGPGARRKPVIDKPRRMPWNKRGLSRAERMIAFLEFLPITKGILAGKKMKLLPAQREFVEGIYGPEAKDGRRLVRLPGYIMEGTSDLAGYRVATTQQLPGKYDATTAVAGTVIFGDWSSLLIGQWSGTDILVNPYGDAAYAKGRVQVRAMRDVDVAVRHIESFAISDDMTIAE